MSSAAPVARTRRWLTRSAALPVLVGIILAVTLVRENDFHRIARTLVDAGWWVPFVIAAHLPQTFLSTLGWRSLILGGSVRLRTLYAIRWVRDSINTLLPLGQVGGDIVRVRLLAGQHIPLSPAAASAVVDVSLELAAQIVFTFGALLLLVAGPESGQALPLALVTVVCCSIAMTAFIGGQRLGMFRAVERLAALGGAWEAIRNLSGLDAAVMAIYRHRRRISASCFYHIVAWLLGSIETFVAMRVIGIAPTIREAIVFEALSYAARAAGFFIPGALGVQEGGFILIGHIFGIAPEAALAMSLLRRIREVVLGLPGLLLWYRMERRRTRPQAGVA